MQERMSKNGIYCHEMVAETAREFANELYDTVMSNNEVRSKWKESRPGMAEKALRKAFVKKNWQMCLVPARATLAALLARPIDENLKERIHEALLLDAVLIRGARKDRLERTGL